MTNAVDSELGAKFVETLRGDQMLTHDVALKTEERGMIKVSSSACQATQRPPLSSNFLNTAAERRLPTGR